VPAVIQRTIESRSASLTSSSRRARGAGRRGRGSFASGTKASSWGSGEGEDDGDTDGDGDAEAGGDAADPDGDGSWPGETGPLLHAVAIRREATSAASFVTDVSLATAESFPFAAFVPSVRGLPL
jgi:hypothetical protein